MVSLVSSHTNATRIGWHLWEIDLRFALNSTPGRMSRVMAKPPAEEVLVRFAQRLGARCTPPTLEATQGQILSQSPTNSTRFWWHLYGN